MHFNKEIIDSILILSSDVKRATMNESGEFKEHIFMNIEEGWSKILVDLQRCEFLDSTFLGALISASRKISKNEGTIGIIASYQLIPSILKLTGTSKMLPVFETKQQAIDSFNSNDH
jgi:anti-anti-sigma factor